MAGGWGNERRGMERGEGSKFDKIDRHTEQHMEYVVCSLCPTHFYCKERQRAKVGMEKKDERDWWTCKERIRNGLDCSNRSMGLLEGGMEKYILTIHSQLCAFKQPPSSPLCYSCKEKCAYCRNKWTRRTLRAATTKNGELFAPPILEWDATFFVVVEQRNYAYSSLYPGTTDRIWLSMRAGEYMEHKGEEHIPFFLSLHQG